MRQKWELGRSHREVAQSLSVGLGTVSDVVHRARRAGLDWAQVQKLAEDVLETRLYGPRDAARTILVSLASFVLALRGRTAG